MKLTVVILAVAILGAGVAIGITLAGGGFRREEPPVEQDTQAPAIKGPKDGKALAYLGEAIAYRSFITVTDNSDNYTLTVDDSGVNKTKEGTYQVHYTATDAAGNKAQ